MRRAIGLIRVSQAAGREGESFVSPTEQRRRLMAVEGIEIVRVHEEIDVSGGTPIERREGLRAAVEAVEAGEADVLAVAYFDRLVRSLRVQGEVVQRVEAAGGRVLALDVGEVSESTAAQWLSGTMLGAVNEYQRRATAERSRAAQADAVARGVAPWPSLPPGYRRGESGRLVPNDDAETVAEAFEMRAGGATIRDVRAFLLERGIRRSYHGVQSMLCSRVVLGELHFGDLVNLSAHEPIVSREVWERVQRIRRARGSRPQSDRLLARLGVLRCASCGARMVVGVQTSKGRRYPFYRCPPVGDCTQRVTIGAEMVEELIVDRLKVVLADAEGRASTEQGAVEAEAEAERTQAELDAAIRAFSALQDEPVALERLRDLRAARDAARERAEHLGSLRSAVRLTVADVDELTVPELRDLIRGTFAAVTVAPGRGLGRVGFQLLGEDAPAGPG